MFLLVPIIIIVAIIVYFINRNKNNMDENLSNKPKTTAGDFLLNIGAIIALYTIVGNLLDLFFTVIDKAYPQITTSYNYYSSSSYSISWPVSILIILFPIFVIIMWFLEKSYSREPEKRTQSIHKWLTYITLFIGGSILVGDLITVVYYFIDGQELTTGFLLKVFSLLAITLIVFLYYLADARNTLTPHKRKIYLVLSLVVVVASIVWGFAVLGSPRTQQLLKYDTQKVNDLQSLNNQVQSYLSSKGALPKNIDELKSLNYYSSLKDQQTGKLYEYVKVSETEYNVCADFNKASPSEEGGGYMAPPLYGYTNWTHPAGHYCFKEKVENNNNYGPKFIPNSTPLTQ